MVMDERKKPKINLSLLPELLPAWESSTEFAGEKRKWMASSAAIYLWLKMPKEAREALAWRLYGADGKPQDRAEVLAELGIAPEHPEAAQRVKKTRLIAEINTKRAKP